MKTTPLFMMYYISGTANALEQEPVYIQKSDGFCGFSVGSAYIGTFAECKKVFPGAEFTTDTSGSRPPGCTKTTASAKFNFNSKLPIDSFRNYECSDSNYKGVCYCAVTCQPGTYQDEPDKSSCKPCPANKYSKAGESSCVFAENNCPPYNAGTTDFLSGTHKSGTSTVCRSNKQEPVYQIYTNDGYCSDIGEGWKHIETAEECTKAAASLYPSWDYINNAGITRQSKQYDPIQLLGWSSALHPMGCYRTPPNACQDNQNYCGHSLAFNVCNTDHSRQPTCGKKDSASRWCTINKQCFCSLTCPSYMYQDEIGKSSCKLCASGKFSVAGASECSFTSSTCPEHTTAASTGTVAFCSNPLFTTQPECETKGFWKNSEKNCYRCADPSDCGWGKLASPRADSEGKCEAAAGTWDTLGPAVCDVCGAGKYNMQTNSGCKDCATGKINFITTKDFLFFCCIVYSIL